MTCPSCVSHHTFSSRCSASCFKSTTQEWTSSQVCTYKHLLTQKWWACQRQCQATGLLCVSSVWQRLRCAPAIPSTPLANFFDQFLSRMRGGAVRWDDEEKKHHPDSSRRQTAKRINERKETVGNTGKPRHFPRTLFRLFVALQTLLFAIIDPC